MERSQRKLYWRSALVTLGSVGLMAFSLLHLRGRMPELKPIPADRGPVLDFVAPEKVRRWFDPAELARPATLTNVDNPFFTRHFEPPPKPKPKPPPTTRKIKLLYQGSIRTSEERQHAFIRAEGKTLVVTNGQHLVANLGVQRISLNQVILTNTSGQTNILVFRVPAQVVVPISPKK
jgi:hypothetical protein